MTTHTLHNFFQGTASPAEEAEIRAWMEASPENRKQFFHERRLFDAMILSPSLNDGKITISHWRNTLKMTLKAAAVVALILATVLITANYASQHPRLTTQQTIIVPAAQRVQLILPDSTVVWLNSNTKLQYPAVFAKDTREVQLDGEAYFEVSKNPKHPFQVSTSRGKIEVTGTSFNVDAYSSRNVFETAVIEGSVIVSTQKELEEPLILKPDQKAVLKTEGLQLEEIDNYDAYLWRRGLIAFKNKSLKEILAQFEKYYDIKISLSDHVAPKHTYTGKFRQTDGVDYALRVLQKSIQFDYERDDEKQIIYIH